VKWERNENARTAGVCRKLVQRPFVASGSGKFHRQVQACLETDGRTVPRLRAHRDDDYGAKALLQ
jgi:hypothetical protein